MELVFTLLAEPYERGGVLMTSNLPFSKWGGILKDAMMTAAAIDRLVHHCLIIECRRCRSLPYLNNIIEQDHRFIKKRIVASLGFGRRKDDRRV